MPELQSEKARALLAELDELLPAEGSAGPWLLGLEHPSGLDTNLVVFIRRMQDGGRGELVLEGLKVYVDRARVALEWERVMQGRETMVR